MDYNRSHYGGRIKQTLRKANQILQVRFKRKSVSTQKPVSTHLKLIIRSLILLISTGLFGYMAREIDQTSIFKELDADWKKRSEISIHFLKSWLQLKNFEIVKDQSLRQKIFKTVPLISDQNPEKDTECFYEKSGHLFAFLQNQRSDFELYFDPAISAQPSPIWQPCPVFWQEFEKWASLVNKQAHPKILPDGNKKGMDPREIRF